MVGDEQVTVRDRDVDSSRVQMHSVLGGDGAQWSAAVDDPGQDARSARG